MSSKNNTSLVTLAHRSSEKGDGGEGGGGDERGSESGRVRKVTSRWRSESNRLEAEGNDSGDFYLASIKVAMLRLIPELTRREGHADSSRGSSYRTEDLLFLVRGAGIVQGMQIGARERPYLKRHTGRDRERRRGGRNRKRKLYCWSSQDKTERGYGSSRIIKRSPSRRGR